MIYNRFFVGIDNGVTGSIAIIGISDTAPMAVHYVKTPTVSQQNYTKKEGKVTRIDAKKLMELFMFIPGSAEVHILMERPMVNPKRLQATLSAIRALESTLTILESLGLPYSYIDSKEWQKELLPKGCKGDALKTASLDIAKRLYPDKIINGRKDADGLLIAHYCYLKNK